LLDSWIRVDAQGITVLTGKVELGQGIKTALIQVAAEELSVEPRRITLVTADTTRTPNEGYTAGSQSMQDSATAIRHAAAQVREMLLGAAATRLGVNAHDLKVENGTVVANDGRRLRYGELVTDDLLHVEAQPQSPLKQPGTFMVMGKPMARVDIPAKVTGGMAYVQDLRLPSMVHARVVRPPSYRARLQSVDVGAVEKLPGVLKVVRDGSFLAVVAEREYQAVRAMSALSRAASWAEEKSLPNPAELYDWLRRARSDDFVIAEQRSGAGTGTQTLEALYQRPYQMHAAIGPSCAVALAENDMLTVWTHSQGVYPLRKSIAEMLRLPQERIRCVHIEGSGCYGHNGADDVAADAALIAHAFRDGPFARTGCVSRSMPGSHSARP
jgi:CO/xanthine dehydrogenase Mo-binding subunit